MNIGICDDELQCLKILKNLILEYEVLNKLSFTVFCYQKGEDFLSEIYKGLKFDFVFLDIYIGDIDGISVALKLREHLNLCGIIFTTSSRDHAISSYELNAIHYLVKPLDSQCVGIALDRAIKDIPNRKEKFIQIQNRKNIYNISLNNIYYAESKARTVTVHTKTQGEIVFYDRLDNFEKQCNDSRFLRCHKSFLVNLDFIRAIEDNCFSLESGDDIRISIRLSKAKSIFASYKASAHEF